MEPTPDPLRIRIRAALRFAQRIVPRALMVGLLASVSSAHAQEGSDDAEQTAVEAVGETADRTSIEPAFGNVDAANVSTDEKKQRVESMIQEQRGALARVTELLGEARASKDIVQLNCVNEKLTQVKGLLKISEKASLELYESIAADAEDLVNHEFTKVVVAHQKSQVIRAEGEQCVGANSVYAGDTSVDVEIEGDGEGGGDPSANSAPPPGPSVPPLASTF